jgi:glutamate dehydrogenase
VTRILRCRATTGGDDGGPRCATTYAAHAQLTAQVLRDTDDTLPGLARIQEWEDGDAVVVARAAATLQEICADDNAELARMSVGLRVVRGLLAN